MSAPEVNNSLKEASIETLRSILSANQDVRKAGESQVQALEVTEGISLEIICCPLNFFLCFHLIVYRIRNLSH